MTDNQPMEALTACADEHTTARDHWERGEYYSIPKCCRARYIIDPFRWLPMPAWLERLGLLRPRFAVADGVVPCEYHLARYVLTGRRPVTDEKRNPLGGCCETRAMMADGGLALQLVTHSVEDIAASGVIVQEPMTVPMLVIDGEPSFSIAHCPWCGTEVSS